MRFSCSSTRINVVRLVSSFRREAPTYVQAERKAAQNITRGIFNRASQRQLNGFTFCCAIFRNAANVTFHRRLGAHAVEQHKFLAVLLNDATAALFVARQHAAKHDEIGTAAKGFAHIARRGAATSR